MTEDPRISDGFRVGQRIEFRQWVGGYVLSVNPLRVRSDYTDNVTTNPREIRPEDEDDPLNQEPDSALPAPSVFLPGDVLPPNVAIMNLDGVLYGPAPGWVVSIPGVAVQIPTVAEVEALVEQEMNERDSA